MDDFFSYAGRILPASDEAEAPAADGGRSMEKQGATPAAAHAEAQSIIQAAISEAEEIRKTALAGVDLEFERQLAERLTGAAREFNLGIAECGAILAEILNDALQEIIGDTKAPELLAKAIAAASARHGAGQSLTVMVSPEDYPRLEVLRLGIPAVKSIRMVADASIARGRCLLEAGGKRFDVSVDAQINAFRQQAVKLVAGMAGAEASL
jgi:type III secretion protein L